MGPANRGGGTRLATSPASRGREATSGNEFRRAGFAPRFRSDSSNESVDQVKG